MTFTSPGITIISSFLLRIVPSWFSELILDPCSIDRYAGLILHTDTVSRIISLQNL